MQHKSPEGRLRAGIVGGGRGSFIGGVHRIAAQLDGEALLVAGAMSSNPAIARESAAAWYLDRSYDCFTEMARAEAALPDGIDFVIVATPNHLHYPVARAFLEAGIHVVCDKPLAFSVAEAEALTGLEGRIWIDSKSHYLVRMEGRISHPVNVGWGMLAHIYPGGTLEMDQTDAGGGRWIFTEFSMKLSVRALMVKTLNVHSNVETSDYQTLPGPMSYQDAIHRLLDTPLPGR